MIKINAYQKTLIDYFKPLEESEQGIYGETEAAYRDGIIGIHEYWLLTGNYKTLKELPSVEDDLLPRFKLGLVIQRAIARAKPDAIYTVDNPNVKADLVIQKVVCLQGNRIYPNLATTSDFTFMVSVKVQGEKL